MVANLSEIFIRRPIATSPLMVAIAMVGGDPGTMSSAVASPLERHFTTIAGVVYLTPVVDTYMARLFPARRATDGYFSIW
jgi:multidrug efflux pump subunit AcrB